MNEVVIPIYGISEEDILRALKRVAKLLSKDTLTRKEYDERAQSLGLVKSKTIVNKFKKWEIALTRAGLDSRVYAPSKDQLLQNLIQLWEKLGRQPIIEDVEGPLSEYRFGQYRHAFKNWRGALKALAAYQNRPSRFESAIAAGSATLPTPDQYFLSYSRKNANAALSLKEFFRSSGRDLWIDQYNLRGGHSWASDIIQAIDQCKGMILLISPESMASPNVAKEVDAAVSRKKLIIPIEYSAATYPNGIEYHLSGIHRVKFEDHDGILNALGQVVGVPSTRVQKESQYPTYKRKEGKRGVTYQEALASWFKITLQDQGTKIMDRDDDPTKFKKITDSDLSRLFSLTIKKEYPTLRFVEEIQLTCDAIRSSELDWTFSKHMRDTEAWGKNKNGNLHIPLTRKEKSIPITISETVVQNCHWIKGFLVFDDGDQVPIPEIKPASDPIQWTPSVAPEPPYNTSHSPDFAAKMWLSKPGMPASEITAKVISDVLKTPGMIDVIKAGIPKETSRANVLQFTIKERSEKDRVYFEQLKERLSREGGSSLSPENRKRLEEFNREDRKDDFQRAFNELLKRYSELSSPKLDIGIGENAIRWIQSNLSIDKRSEGYEIIGDPIVTNLHALIQDLSQLKSDAEASNLLQPEKQKLYDAINNLFNTHIRTCLEAIVRFYGTWQRIDVENWERLLAIDHGIKFRTEQGGYGYNFTQDLCPKATQDSNHGHLNGVIKLGGLPSGKKLVRCEACHTEFESNEDGLY